MHPHKTTIGFFTAALLGAGLAVSALGQDGTPAAPAKDGAKPATPAGMDDPAMMAKMMELGKPGENHKLLAELAGSWTYKVKMWMDPSAPPQESSGTATRKPTLDGRFFAVNANGKMQMPDATGKMKSMEFQGMGLEGYDNVKQKFVSTWADSMGTGVMISEGTYDAAAKAFTYTSEMEMMPGMKSKVREVITVADKNHHKMEWFEDRGGKEVKTMEISYTREK